MTALKEEILNIIHIITFKPESIHELIGLSIVGCLVGILTLQYVSTALGSAMSDKKRAVIIFSITLLPVIVLCAVLNTYCIAELTNEAIKKWAPIVTAVFLTIAIGVPACKLINRMKYSSSSFAVILTVLAVWGSTLLGNAAISAAKAASKQFGKATERQEEIQKTISR